MIVYGCPLLIKWQHDNKFVFLILKIMSLGSALVLLTTTEAKTQRVVHLSFSSTLQLINRISSKISKIF